jgi:hypothetical protein
MVLLTGIQAYKKDKKEGERMRRGDDRWLRRSFWTHAGCQLHATRLSTKASAHKRAPRCGNLSSTTACRAAHPDEDNKSIEKSGARTSPLSLYRRGDPQVWNGPAVLDGHGHNLIKWTKCFHVLDLHDDLIK